MKNDYTLIDEYLDSNYENSYNKNKSKYELISNLYEKLSKINSYIEKFIKEKMDSKIMKVKLQEYNGEENFYNLFLLLKNTIDSTFNENYNMFNEILESLGTLKEIFKSYFKKYEEFFNIQKKFANKLNEIENYKNNFLETAKKAEMATYEYLKKKLFKKSTKQSEFNEKEELKNSAKLQLEKYKSKINEGNNELSLFNEFQKETFKSEKELEIKYNGVYSDCLMTYLEHQLTLTNSQDEIKERIVQLNQNSNTKKLKDYLNKYHQKDEINMKQYCSYIDFERCKDELELSACYKAYNEMENSIGKYKEIDLQKEKEKLEIGKIINRILHLDEKITDEDTNQLKELVKTNIGQTVFINIFSKLRANGIYEKPKKFILEMVKVINIIMEYSKKEKYYDKIKNCFILSQTFYYSDTNNKEKTKNYIFEFIKNIKWLKSTDFWRTFIDTMLQSQIKKRNVNIKKLNLNDILLTQLLPHINNMKEIGIDIRIIIKIVDEFLEKYNYLNKESYKTLFSIISDDIKIIEKYRKEYKENPNLEKELYNESADIINEKINVEDNRIENKKIENNKNNE